MLTFPEYRYDFEALGSSNLAVAFATARWVLICLNEHFPTARMCSEFYFRIVFNILLIVKSKIKIRVKRFAIHLLIRFLGACSTQIIAVHFGATSAVCATLFMATWRTPILTRLCSRLIKTKCLDFIQMIWRMFFIQLWNYHVQRTWRSFVQDLCHH